MKLGGDGMAPYIIVKIGGEWHVAKLIRERYDQPTHYYSSFHCRDVEVAKEILAALQNTANREVL